MMNTQPVLKSHTKLFLQARKFYEQMKKRRTIRKFTSKDIPTNILEECIKVAGTAPSGANCQPWFFAVVKSSEIKRQIREQAEKEELEFYKNRADQEFLNDLKPFDVNWKKPHLEEASALIVIFAKSFDYNNEKKKRCYYSKESVGIATGFLITALHKLGVATLTHTPNPMRFLNQILKRPSNEKPFLILAVGYQSPLHTPPHIEKKELAEYYSLY